MANGPDRIAPATSTTKGVDRECIELNSSSFIHFCSRFWVAYRNRSTPTLQRHSATSRALIVFSVTRKIEEALH